jgi:hypothetical protein
MESTCPVCEREMEFSGQIGHYCVYEDCPVLDDALLWYKNNKGEWKCQEWVSVKTEQGYFLRLSEKEYD